MTDRFALDEHKRLFDLVVVSARASSDALVAR